MASKKIELWPCCSTTKIVHSCRSRDHSVFLSNSQVGFSFEKKLCDNNYNVWFFRHQLWEVTERENRKETAHSLRPKYSITCRGKINLAMFKRVSPMLIISCCCPFAGGFRRRYRYSRLSPILRSSLATCRQRVRVITVSSKFKPRSGGSSPKTSPVTMILLTSECKYPFFNVSTLDIRSWRPCTYKSEKKRDS